METESAAIQFLMRALPEAALIAYIAIIPALGLYAYGLMKPGEERAAQFVAESVLWIDARSKAEYAKDTFPVHCH